MWKHMILKKKLCRFQVNCEREKIRENSVLLGNPVTSTIIKTCHSKLESTFSKLFPDCEKISHSYRSIWQLNKLSKSVMAGPGQACSTRIIIIKSIASMFPLPEVFKIERFPDKFSLGTLYITVEGSSRLRACSAQLRVARNQAKV